MPRLFDPVGDEDVGRACPAVVAVGAERDALAVGREHREAVKRIVETDLDGLHAVDVGHENVEREGARFVVGAEQDVLAVRVEVGGPVGAAEVGDLAHLAAVGLGDVQFHFRRLYQAARQKAQVLIHSFAHFGAARAPHDVLAIGAEEGTAVIAQLAGNALDVAAIDVAGVEVQVAVAGAGEDDFVAFRADGGFRVIAFASDQQFGLASAHGSRVDVIARINGPDVLVVRAATGYFRARRVGGVGGGVEDFLVAGHEVGAGGAAKSRADWCRWGVRRRAVGEVHHVDLIAFHTPTWVGRLEDEAAPVKRPVGFGIVAAVCELANVVEVHLFFIAAVEAVRQIRQTERSSRS